MSNDYAMALRILQVATLFSPDGAYGGPIRVATNQSVELVRRGHHVLLAGAARGYARPPGEVSGVPACLQRGRYVLPGIGYAGLAAPGLLRKLGGLTMPPDVVHVHLARDLVTLPVARWALDKRLPLVLQTHGMIDPTEKVLAKPLDLALTVPILRAAGRVFCLTDSEVEDIHRVAGSSVQTSVLPNGIPISLSAESSGARSGVVFVGRLHHRKRPMLFVRMAQEAIRRGADASFELIGPDEGEGASVRQALREDDGGGRIRWVGAVPPDQVPSRLARAAVLVNTTENERFGMSILEAMAAGCAVVVGRSCGLANVISAHGSGITTTESAADFAAAVMSLLDDPVQLVNRAGRGQRLVSMEYSIASVADRLEGAYQELSEGRDSQ